MKKDKITNTEKEAADLQTRLQKDFSVRNMPAFSSFSGLSYEDASVQGNKISKIQNNQSSGEDSQHKKTGLMIMGAGLIIVGILLYLAYRFLIVPAMQPSTPIQVPAIDNKPELPIETVEVIPVIVATTTTTTTESVVIPVEEVIIATSSEILPAIVLPIITDSDNDGLSDIAETFLGTNSQLADTDADSYLDKQEILSGYNPAGEGELSDNLNLAVYLDPADIFAVVYPQAWSVQQASVSAILFSAPDESFIQIALENNEQAYPDILAWYLDQFPDDKFLDAERLIESSFGPAILSSDNQIAYFLSDDGSHILVVSYIKAGEEVSYLNVFKMIVSTLMPVQ